MHAEPEAWLVVGADGQIGRELVRRLQAEGKPIRGTSRRGTDGLLPLDLGEPQGWELPERVAMAYLCAAATSIDRCEKDPDGTRLINMIRTLELAAKLRERGAHLIFLSTNQVFDGTQPHRSESSPVCPRTEYGRQKAAVEKSLLDRGGAAILRFTKVAMPGWKLIGEWAEALSRGESISAFADMVMAPVPLAFAVEALVKIGEAQATGIFHASGDVDVSYAEVARRLADRLGASRDLVRPISIADRNLPRSAAPTHTTLNAERLQRELGLTCPSVFATLDGLFEFLHRSAP